MKKLTYALICLVLLNCQQENPQSKLTPEAQKTEDIILLQKEAFDIPGMAIGLIKNGKVVYSNAHGVQGLDTKVPMSTKSIFHMASVSKPFVATAIVQLVEKGNIDLDEKLTFYLPYFKMADSRYKDITIRHMLNHSSGIPDVDDYEWDKPQYDDGAAERYARSFDKTSLDFTPGEKYSYSNPAFDILADVISKVSGLTFEAYMKKYIFDPIGMKNTTFYKPDVPEKLATKPHILGDSLQRVVRKVYPYNRRHAPSSTLHSNVEDMLLWAEVNLNKGIINGNRIYKEISYDLLTTPGQAINKSADICLSWFRSTMHSTTKYSHSGGDPGYSTYFAFIPEEKSAIVMMENIDGFWSAYSANTIINNVIFKDSVSWKSPISYKLKDHILIDGIEKVKAIHNQEKQRNPQKYNFDDGGFLDGLGYWLLNRDHLDKALEVFMFNIELYPEYAGWYDSVGDAYKEMDSIDLAIEWYQKALKIKPDQDFTIKKLNKLLKKKS